MSQENKPEIKNDTNETNENDEEDDEWMNEFIFKSEFQLLGHKVIKNYNKHILNSKEDLIPCILVATGTFSPVHRMHVVNMELAKQHIEKSNCKYRVLGGFISPTHDYYCKYKLGDLYIPAIDRIKMLSLALEDNNWIEVSPWHPNQDHMRSINAEVEYIEIMIQHLYLKKEQYKKFIIFYVCGSDLANKCQFNYGFDNYGVCIIQRESDLMLPSYIKLNCNPPVFLIDIPNKYNNVKNASSTELRYCIYHGKLINHLTFDKVQKYMVENDILGASRLKQVLFAETLKLKTNVSDSENNNENDNENNNEVKDEKDNNIKVNKSVNDSNV
eukprot:281970_1